jgi:DNA-binding transcriptional MerR regulator
MSSPALKPVPDSEIPNKLYFRIGEVSRLAGVKPYVLRYWETEFSSIGPKKSGSNHRLYRRKDVELILEIKRLLYDKRFTIEGARKFLESKSKSEPKLGPKPVKKQQTDLFAAPSPEPASLAAIRQEIASLLELLSD